MKILVIDPNVVVSGSLGRGHSNEIFALNNELREFLFISPQYFYIEIGRHTSEIIRRTKFSLEEIQKVFLFIVNQIKFYSELQYQNKIQEAREILKGHEKDVPYLALALAFNCDILSGDKTFRELCPDKVKTPKEILEMFEKI